MSRFSSLRVGALLFLTAAVAFAADITGAWAGQISGPNGGDGFPVSYSFKQDGMKLTGTVAGPQGDPIEISDGMVDGDKISFSVTFNGMTFKHVGTISGEEIRLTMKSEGADLPGGSFVIRKSKA